MRIKLTAIIITAGLALTTANIFAGAPMPAADEDKEICTAPEPPKLPPGVVT